MRWPRQAKRVKQGRLLATPLDDPVRCRECDGVCCRAFVAIELSWDEYLRLEALGATQLEFSLTGHHRLVIENGCEFLVAGRCRVYDDRPDICRRFICEDK